MKRLLFVGAIIVVASIIGLSGCALEKSYKLDYSSSYGFCQEVITNDVDVQDELAAAGYEEGACPSSNKLGTCSISDSSGGTSYTINQIYYDGSIWSSTTTAEDSCDTYGGNWSSN